MFPLEFRTKVNHEETRVMGLSSSEDRMIAAWVILTCQDVVHLLYTLSYKTIEVIDFILYFSGKHVL